MGITTGWFGQPRRGGRSTNVHVLKEDGTCLCGYKAHNTYEYQWSAPGINLDYLECKSCIKKAEILLKNYDKEKYNEYLHRKTSKNHWKTGISFLR